MTLKYFLLAIFMVFTLVARLAKGQEPAKENLFNELLDRVKKADSTVNFMDLRIMYTETPMYNPYDIERGELHKAMDVAVDSNQFDKAIQYADSILDKNYLDIDTHMLLAYIYKQLNNVEKAKFHTFVAVGLLKSILQSGDGQSPETAYIVISTAEEYSLLRVLQFKMKAQALIEHNQQKYDRMELENVNTGEKVIRYFNVELPLGSFAKLFKEK